MRALIYAGPRDIRCEEVPEPTPQDLRGAVVRVSACGICGSDLHLYHASMGQTGFCIGHEAVGEVVEVGSQVQNFRPGDRVLIPGSVGCNACPACLRGETTLCQSFPFVRVYGQGTPEVGGCQAEAVAVPEADGNLIRLNSGISDKVGLMLTDNLSTAWYGSQRARVGPGDVVAVIGLGPVGLQCVAASFVMGASRVFAIDRVAARRAIAAEFGAEPLASDDPLSELLDATEGAGADAVIDACGGAATTDLAVRLARRGGRVSIIGVGEQPSFEFPMLFALSRNLDVLTGACSVQAQIPTLLRLIENGRLDVAAIERLFTHELPLTEGDAAYALFNARSDGVVKVLLDPSR
jgi:alcohol dehydrogenase